MREHGEIRIVIIVVLVISGIVGGFLGGRMLMRQRAARLLAAKELAAADQSRAEQNLRESKARREAEGAARAERQDARIQKALEGLRSDRPMSQCDAALDLGRMEAREHVEALVTLMFDERASNARACAASALVRLGEKERALNAYAVWAAGTNADLRRSALVGFGEIGPAAADVGTPFLNEALKSPYADERMIASMALSKLR